MAFLEYLFLLFFILVSFLMIAYRSKYWTTTIPINWPILGTIPSLVVNIQRFADYTSENLIQNHGTFMFKGPRFAGLDMLFTSDPLNVHHILSKNFSNYPKGDKFFKIFDFLGDGIFNSEGKIWETNHKIIFSILKNEEFQCTMESIVCNKLENGLLPILASICECGTEFDLQDIFQRFSFDITWTLLFDNDPKYLSLDFPDTPFSKTFIYSQEAILLRHVTPPCIWRLQQVLGVGKENKFINGWKNLDAFIYKYLAQKHEHNNMKHEEEKFMFSMAIMRELKVHHHLSSDPTKYLRDTFVNLLAAGKDTISSALCWFFYLLAQNPAVEDKILKEIQTHHLDTNARIKRSTKEFDKMVYLHGALCESLRLYPPVPFNHKSPLQPEILPSGHHVDQNTTILLSFYAMGRMKSIWGEDCNDFKPERWIHNNGGIKNQPSYKFPVFNAGPRTCLGKNMSLSQLKIVSTAIISHYHIQLVENHPVLPAASVILHMKHGLKVRLNKRG